MSAAELNPSTPAPEVTDEDAEEMARAFAAAVQHLSAGVKPCETHIDTFLVPTTGDPIIGLQFRTDTGPQIYFVSQQVARSLGVDLQKKGSAKKLAVVTR